MTIKLNLMDKTKSNRRRMVAASGGFVQSEKENSSSPLKYAASTSVSIPITKNAQMAGSAASVLWTQPMFFSPLHTPQSWQTPNRRREMMQWARFYYQNEPKVAAGVDFYATFPMNGFKLECKSRKILKYYEKLCKKICLAEKLNSISHEYFLLGDVFPFLEIECPVCAGKGSVKGKPCKHEDGSFKSIKLMNPDYVEVKDNPIASKPEFYLVPDEELKRVVQRKEPKSIYERLPLILINLISSGQPIPLSDRCISHIKHNASDYGTYGSSMLQRLFTILAYKTKLMTANWIVAERLILPIRVVKVGDKDRPATDADLSDVQAQLGAVANDPNMTIVTHHAFDYDWIGSTGKIHNINQELELIGKEILDGLMLNQAILNGEAVGYTSAQVGVEILIRRLENWRNKLKEWVEKHIFLPIAMMQGFIDEKETKESGETEYLYPSLIWNDLQLRDKTSRIQTLLQCFDKGLVSAQTILEELNLDYDSEVEKIRNEQLMASASGQVAGQQGGNLGTMGMGAAVGGAGGGGAGGIPPDIGGAPGGMPGAPGMAPGGGAPGGAPGGPAGAPGGGGGMSPGGGAMASTDNSMLPKIGKRGSKKDQEEQLAPPPKPIKLTKLEQKVFKLLTSMDVKENLFAQYLVKAPGEQRPYVIDFAYPSIGVGIEADGAIWHQRQDFQQRDLQRDQKLAKIGWRILRFKEDVIDEQIDAVKNAITVQIEDAKKQYKKSEEDGSMIKTASVEDENSIYEYMMQNQEKIGCYRQKIPFGEILFIGVVADE